MFCFQILKVKTLFLIIYYGFLVWMFKTGLIARQKWTNLLKIQYGALMTSQVDDVTNFTFLNTFLIDRLVLKIWSENLF